MRALNFLTSLFDNFSLCKYSGSHDQSTIYPYFSNVTIQALLAQVPPLVDNEGGVKLRMLHTPSPGNLVLPLLGQFLLLRNIEVHGAMSETGASQPLNGVGGLWDGWQFPSVFRLVDCTRQFVTRFDVEFQQHIVPLSLIGMIR